MKALTPITMSRSLVFSIFCYLGQFLEFFYGVYVWKVFLNDIPVLFLNQSVLTISYYILPSRVYQWQHGYTVNSTYKGRIANILS